MNLLIIIVKILIKKSKPIEGIFNFLEWAKNKNISMAVCTNKQEKLAVDLLKKIKMFNYFDYIAGCDTFNYNKPDPRHLTDVIEITGGKLNKTIMVGDSEVDAISAYNAKIPFVLVEGGYTEKTSGQIKHNVLIKNFNNFDKVIEKYL
ncbi:HAD-IA family hydrolase [Pelagibacteraceae bacterium]|nr:HAD-IA family hydrolase [Pelagibacteraceae bacterium]